MENQLETKQTHLETAQKAAPDLEGQSERIQQQIIRINQQRAQLAVEYKQSVRVSTMNFTRPIQLHVCSVQMICSNIIHIILGSLSLENLHKP